MEPQGKRTHAMMEEGSCKPADYMNQVKEELESILSYPSHEDLIRDSLMKLGHDVTDIKSSLEKKKPKVTLVQIDEKLDAIMNLLRTPYGEPRSKRNDAVQYEGESYAGRTSSYPDTNN